jgi:hypothetical protein
MPFSRHCAATSIFQPLRACFLHADYVYDQSQGQPWIVNSLFKRATMRVLREDSTETVTIEHIREARQQTIDARETHLDALAVRLQFPGYSYNLESLS